MPTVQCGRDEDHHDTMAPGLVSPWRIVEATVQLSLTPCQVGNGGAVARNAAAIAAFSYFLMRYNRSLGGVVVARRGGLRFPGDCANVRLTGASPFAHITAQATVLLFAPPAGTVMTGTVTHIGPDHVGMSVLRVFHAVLPLDEFLAHYAYAQEFKDGALSKWWRYVGENGNAEKKAVHLGSRIQFLVKALRSSTDGLFHIGATMNAPDDQVSKLGLGILENAPEDDVDMPEEDASCFDLNESRNSSDIEVTAPLRRASVQSPILMQEMDAFDDELGLSLAISNDAVVEAEDKAEVIAELEPEVESKVEPQGISKSDSETAPAMTPSKNASPVSKKKKKTKKRKKEERMISEVENDASADRNPSSDRKPKKKKKKRRNTTHS